MVDKEGNLVNKDGKKVYLKKEMSDDGEFPKILPYTKFDINQIKGDCDRDGSGKVILLENKKGETVDKKGRRVNSKGYLIDNEGNIIDQRKNRVFDKDILSEEGEIPKVFRMGLLR